MIKVRAKEMVYYGHKRRKEGDVFVLKDEKHFSERSMQKLDKVEHAEPEEVEIEEDESFVDDDVI